MHPVEQAVSASLTRCGIHKTDSILVGCSGGADSVALLYALSALGFTPGVAHVNYRLRGDDSDADAALVKHHTGKLQLPFYLHQVVNWPHGNLQQAARNIRFNFFEELNKKQKIRAVLLGHHAGDREENLLLGLFRGDPLFSIDLEEIRLHPFPVLRPLLSCSKKELYSYLDENGIQFREDVSNQSEKYNRNWIRNNVIAGAVPRFPDVHGGLVKSADEVSVYKWLLSRALQDVSEGNGLNVERLQALPRNVCTAVLRMWLAERGIASGLPASIVRDTESLFSLNPGKRVSLDRDLFIQVTDKHLVIVSAKTDQVIEIHEDGREVVAGGVRFYRARTSGADMNGTALIWRPGRSIRTRKPGDQIHVEQSKKPLPVKKLLENHSITGIAKQEALLLLELDGTAGAVIFHNPQQRLVCVPAWFNVPAEGESLIISPEIKP
jgi:tRNA(Ile)-lysidine synthetase-like protein